ncbi:MAG: efflux RND transporter periplasmic adaptor subunit, partial [Anaerolineales bacterium]
DEPEIQTATVRQGDLVVLASGTGTLVPHNEMDLGFGTNGIIEEILVHPGDEVLEGDALAFQGNRDELEAAVATAKIAVLNAQEALDEIYENADAVTAQAVLDLANAQDELESAEYTMIVQQEGNRASEAMLDAARAELTLAESALNRARSDYNSESGSASEDAGKAAALAKLASAQLRYDSAVRNWNWMTGSPSAIEQAQLESEVALAEAKVSEAERNLELVAYGPNLEEIEKAELTLANANANLAIAERNLEESIVEAPFDGTILTVNGQVGDKVTAPFITITDTSQPYLEIYLDETDLALIDLEYAVEVIFDALPDFVFEGVVVQVDPALYTNQNVSMVRGLVALNENSQYDTGDLLFGMNAAVDVIAGEVESATLAPVEALRELSPGEYAVFVMGEDGELTLHPVEVGLIDISFAEIISGLEPGEVVTTGIVETE